MSRPALTVDVVVLACGEHPGVLLVERRHDPFVGAWALPGGFVDEGERIQAAARRELAEETAVEHGVELELLGVYDAPGRDPRGWTVSVAHLVRCRERLEARAGDDARDARWFALDELPPLAFDHAQMIADALALAQRTRRT